MGETYDTYDKVIEAPFVVEDVSAAKWDDETDIVIVGFGAAGASAALQAREGGADVIVLDRFGGGGASAFSGGVIYAGGGTSIQRGAGISDTPEEMAKYLAMEVGDAARPETIQRYAEESRETLEWLMRHGVPYDSTFYREKTVYPPEGYFLQYSGNEKVPEYACTAKPAARGHRAVGKGFTGYVMFGALKNTAKEMGVRILTHSPVTRLLIDREGQVIGVEATVLPTSAHARHAKLYGRVKPATPFNAATAARSARAARALEETKGQRRLIRARRGVVLSTGDFAHNMEMLRQYAPFLARNIQALMRMSSLGCNGSGIRLGMSVGAAATGLDRMYVGRNMAPPASFIHGVMVNARGTRFVNEAAYNSIVGRAILSQPGGAAWLILTRRDYRKAIREGLFSGWNVFRFFGAPAILNILFGGTKHAPGIEVLARKCGMDLATLSATVDRYNQTIGGNDDFGKLAENKIPVVDKGYYAINFSIPNKFAFTQIFTMGGLAVDEVTGEVLRSDGSPVIGLYAAGRTAYGLCSNNYVSGLSLGDCVFSGRRAARHCASRAVGNQLR
jgi:3-oxo-5alpha-steroid 4-dehydrogenase